MKKYFSILIFAYLGNAMANPIPPYNAIRNFYLTSKVVKSFDSVFKYQMWKGKCSNLSSPKLTDVSFLGKFDTEDPVLGKQERAVVLFNFKTPQSTTPRQLFHEFRRLMKEPTFEMEYSPLYFDKAADALVGLQYPIDISFNERSGDPLFLMGFRQKVTEKNEVIYVMQMIDFHSNEEIKYCYFYEDFSYDGQ